MTKRKAEMSKTEKTENTNSVPEVKSISLRDFKSWLSGVEEMQDDGWSPSAEQWRKIRQKIELIKQDDLHTVQKDSPKKHFEEDDRPVIMPASTFERPMLPAVTPAPLPPSVPMATTDGGTIKTPNVTTPGYKSPFA